MMMRGKLPLMVCVTLALVAAAWSGIGTMSVQTKTSPLRSSPSFLGPVVTQVAYGDQVDVLQQQGDWLQVREAVGNGRSGWIHQSALSSKRIVLQAGEDDPRVAASGEEIALAGKGFNADVEAEYQSEHRSLNYAWVDEMESYAITPQEMVRFLQDGGVQPRRGGAQ